MLGKFHLRGGSRSCGPRGGKSQGGGGKDFFFLQEAGGELTLDDTMITTKRKMAKYEWENDDSNLIKCNKIKLN